MSIENSQNKEKIDPVAKETHHLVIATWGLSFVTVLLFAATCYICWEATHQSNFARRVADSANLYTRQSLELTRKSNTFSDSSLHLSDSSFNLTKKSLEITNRSLDLDQENLEIQNRAYMSVTTLDPDTNTGDNPVRFSVATLNAGKTPAYKLLAVISAENGTSEEIFKQLKMPVHNFSQVGANSAGGLSAIVPKYLFREAVSSNGKLKLYIYGRITYEDIFFKKHFVNFCYYYNPEENLLAACQNYNGEDR